LGIRGAAAIAGDQQFVPGAKRLRDGFGDSQDEAASSAARDSVWQERRKCSATISLSLMALALRSATCAPIRSAPDMIQPLI
jgi:hypothetical protein